jgi:hypothetical protein
MPLLALFVFAAGAASGAAVMTTEVREKARPWLRSAIKRGLVVGTELRRSAAGLVEDFEDLVDEAKAEHATAGVEAEKHATPPTHAPASKQAP